MKKTDVIKTWNYLKRNGIKNAVYAARERLYVQYDADYRYENPSAAELQRQRENLSWKENAPKISIVVPVYETAPAYLRALLDSVCAQTYNGWELILADAGSTDQVRKAIQEYQSQNPKVSLEIRTENRRDHFENQKILYFRLDKNEGISGNTNAALQMVSGDYVGLLDHDDFLTPDALYRMADELQEAKKEGVDPVFVYSDEDKYEEGTKKYHSPNRKDDFNLDLLLSNNYICHFLVMKKSMMMKRRLRPEYDGAQDYDLILRTVHAAIVENESSMHPAGDIADTAGMEIAEKWKQMFRHIPRVLYHWRCHSNSTAENPGSKSYAYEAGRRALQDYLKYSGLTGEAALTRHLGFYKVRYQPDLFHVRSEIGACGGSVYNIEHRITSGMINPDGRCPFENMPIYFAGPCNRASVAQDAYALDARTVFLRQELIPFYQQYIKLPYPESVRDRNRNFSNRLDDRIWKQRSIALSCRLREEGYLLLWDPDIQIPE